MAHRDEAMLGSRVLASVWSPALKKTGSWRQRYARRLAVTDALVLLAALFGAILLRFGSENDTRDRVALNSPVLAALLGVVWMVALQGLGARDRRIVADTSDEYWRVLTSSVIAMGLLSIVLVLFKMDVSRGFLAVAFPLGLLGLVVSRHLWRVWLRRRRRSGRETTPVLLAGTLEATAQIAEKLARDNAAGMRVVGMTTDVPSGWVYGDHAANLEVPVFSRDYPLHDAVAECGARAVIVTNPADVGHLGIRDMFWSLPEHGVDVLVAPHLVDIHPNRLHLTHVADMPFIQVEEPGHSAAGSWPKVIFDRVGAAVLVALASPILVLVAIAVKFSSPGPVFYRQERVGKDGAPFLMTKFRSMRVGADDELAQLLAEAGCDASPLAKVKQDPRVTSIGAFLRRHSIDELPQLFDVLRGDMSLVGPRPQRDFEVARYQEVDRRRLRVRPGMTGLWQVSGRSDLSWEDAIRLDTYYVENWSLFGDVVILWRTVRAVVFSDGAY